MTRVSNLAHPTSGPLSRQGSRMAAPMNEIGIRQGRLSPSSTGAVQRFPRESWSDEFHLARDCGLQFLEWLFAADGYEQNPVWSVEGRRRIQKIVETTGVGVRS